MSLISDSAQLITFLRKWARGVRHVRLIMTAVIVLGAFGGLATTGLLALMNASLAGNKLSLQTIVVTFIALCVLLPVSRYYSAALLLRVTVDALFELRFRLCVDVLAAPLRRLEEHGPHRVVNVLAQDVPAIAMALTNVPLLCTQLAIVAGSLCYLGWLSWRVLLLVAVFMVVGIATYQLPVMRSMRGFHQLRRFMDVLMKHFYAVTGGTKELQLHQPRRAVFIEGELRPTLEDVRRTSLSANLSLVAAASWGQVLFFVVIGLILFGPAVFHGSRAVLFGYSIVILYMMAPLEGILATVPSLNQAAAAIAASERLGLLLEGASGRLPAPPAAVEPLPPWHRLELAGITHSYGREGEVGTFKIGPLDLVFHAGQLVFLTGGNGSGKTTVAKLLTGLYLPESGDIRLDGRPVTDQDRERYRQYFSAVFTDFHLFEKLLGLTGPDLDERALRQLMRLKLQHKVEVRQGALSTLELSQGQRKRLALLTACLEDRPIYLFDEWAADQDSTFKEIFYRQVLPELKAQGKTVIAITHDDRYYPVADRIIKLDSGQVVYDGAPIEEPAIVL